MHRIERVVTPESARPAGHRRRLGIVIAAAAVAAVLGFMPSDLEAQGNLPLPVPGAPPTKDDRLTPQPPPPGTLPLPVPGAPAPNAPAVPGAPGEDARARAAAMAAKANIDVTDAWAKATTPNATTAQIYLHLVSAKDPDRLIGLEVSNATRIDVREPTDQGAAKGTAAPSVDVPPGGTVNFAPGGRHLLLTGLKAPLREGDSFLLTLRFDKGGSQTAVVKILGANASGPPQTSAARTGDTTAGATAR